MRLATFTHQGKTSWGVVLQDAVCDMPARWPHGPRTLLEALEGGPDVLHRIANLATVCPAATPLSAVRLLAPIPRPPKLLGLAVNYLEHHRETTKVSELDDQARRYTTPRPFLMPSTAVIGPGETIAWPVTSRQIDHEVELAVVIGRRCKAVSPQQARDCIAGYTIANDMSARSATCAEGRKPRPKDDFFDWLHGKWPDGFCPLGPWIVTADEVGDPQALDLELTVNGEVRQQANTAQMIFPVYELVSFCSQSMTLEPGDVIATGTPSGVGMATGKWLAGGDVITCRIQNIGELTNTLGQPPANFYTPCRNPSNLPPV